MEISNVMATSVLEGEDPFFRLVRHINEERILMMLNDKKMFRIFVKV